MSLNPTDSGTVDSGVKDPGSTPIWSSPGEGGSGGNPFDDSQPSLGGVTEIRVWADKYIDAIQVAYVDTVTPKHGGGGGHAYTFFLDTDEKIVKINGRGSKYIDQLQFFTDIGRSSPVYGGSGGNSFSWSPPQDYYLRNFSGRSDK